MEEASPSLSQSPPQDWEQLKDSSEMEMEVGHAPLLPDEAGSNWDWGDLLDFTVDDDLAIQWDSSPVQNHPVPVQSEPPGQDDPDPSRVRKRDPRVTCSNFMAGRVPCACPEVDEKLMELEEEAAGHDKKRTRTTTRSPAGVARCQVPTCGANIKELKGYHRRHRVCLKCANAATVVINGESKRYCQQCGKFHMLSDFDEGKRSCRRKLERHNRRRRKIEPKRPTEKECLGDLQSEDVSGDVEAGKDCSQLSSQKVQKETCVESEGGHISPLHTPPDPKDVQSDGFISLVDSGETQMDAGKYNSKHGVSLSSCDNRSAYSSVCPTGRISFKLYDWNPAEFPRRLRHQIFQWLASMPVELEGYIRPGCIILTVFVAMPSFMWKKLSEDPISYVHDFVVAPGGMLSGRGNMLVYLNNTLLHVVKGGSSVIKAKVNVRAPRLHYVHPICFEAGQPMEFVACGSNLLQPKLRFLLSLSGKYLAYDYNPEYTHFQTEGSTASDFDHQFYRICVPHTEPNCFGPLFIEVENEAGLSNFIPVLIGDKETCSELKVIRQRLNESLFSDGPYFSSTGSLSKSWEVSSQRKTVFSEVILDIAWLLKKPGSENFQQITTSQVQRINYLLNFLISIESTTILEKILRNLLTVMDKMKLKDVRNGIHDADLRALQKYVDHAQRLCCQKLQKIGGLGPHTRNFILVEDPVCKTCSQNDACSDASFPIQDTEILVHGNLGNVTGSTCNDTGESIPLLKEKLGLKSDHIVEWPIKATSCTTSAEVLVSHRRAILRFHPTLCLIATVAVCLGICSVLFHPYKVSDIAVSIRRCLLNKL
ncbi:SBP-box transcription factor [Parasponia andersonii]|uniref:SBP-box transcription factor n=1 Tax=Parasponia andersonii TaxID=3476 RepID=A0A2P5E3Z4_PARAD|nr:SBP-box transcription factor [Parasponia andersonii]